MSVSLSRDEILALARQRLLRNLINDIIHLIRKKDPSLYERLEKEIISEYLKEIEAKCTGRGSPKEIIACITRTKRENEPHLKKKLESL